ncbi:hypothetical protein [Nocardia abscessus]|uniref:hypothetical protein n=1 Tax=Nocardia abscessus TaxID=120957 RepID=UPI0002EB3FDA|nr:hypothetical protein [Nocardia abscessus]MCC3332928.1 hypothetical protein [Nocardia abscessus]
MLDLHRSRPELFRPCPNCGTAARLHYLGLCDGYAALKLLDAALSGPDGTLRTDLELVRRALAASRSTGLLNSIRRRPAATLLAQIVASDGPVTHDAIYPAHIHRTRPATSAKH